MRYVLLPVIFLSMTILVQAQATRGKTGPAPAAQQPAQQQAAPQAAGSDGVDSIIELVQGKMSEDLVVKTIQRQGKAYDLSPGDLVKLQKAGVSERIISTMMEPTTAPASAPPAAAPAAERFAPAPAAPAAPPAAEAPGTRGPAVNPNAKAAPAEAPANQQQEKKGGFFSSLKSRLGQSAQKTADGIGDTADTAVTKTTSDAQSKVSTEMDNAVGTVTPGDKGTGANGTGANGTATGQRGAKGAAAAQPAAAGTRTAATSATQTGAAQATSTQTGAAPAAGATKKSAAGRPAANATTDATQTPASSK